MAEGASRPGGLTVLAVLNFIFGALGMIGLVLAFGMLGKVTEGEMAEAMEAIPPKGVLLFSLAIGAVSTILLIIAGVGYLKQKKFLGRTLGSTYAILAIVGSVVAIVAREQPFKIIDSIGLIYPVVTLALLNTSFKEDFINP